MILVQRQRLDPDDARAMAYAFEAPARGSGGGPQQQGRSKAAGQLYVIRHRQLAVGRCLITDVFHNNTGRSAISASVAPAGATC
jgi:hypothetical protein